MTKKKILTYITSILVAGVLAACQSVPVEQSRACEYEPYNEIEKIEEKEEIEEIIEELPPISILISAVGDIMMHMAQIHAAHDSATDTHDFHNNFIYVRPYLEKSDLAIGNLETTFGGRPYAGFPRFSAPDSVAPALKAAGFDVIVTANNHTVDRDKPGLLRTIDVLLENDLVVSGSRRDETQPRFAIFEVQGVNIAVIAYTYASSDAAGRLQVNGIPAEDSRQLLNYFRYTHLYEDLENARQDVLDARAAGADIVIMYYHWGNEYFTTSNDWQRRIAARTVNYMYVDIIFGSHPHVLQEAVYLTSELTGRQVPVFYSLGNFISNQRRETLPTTRNNRHTETGAIAQVRVEFDPNNREIISKSKSAIPTWVDRHQHGGRLVYTIIPLDENLETNSILARSGYLSRAQRAWEDAIEILRIN